MSHVSNLFRSLLSWLLAAAVVCACFVAFFYFYRADEEIRRAAEKTLAARFPNQSVTVNSASLVQGEGVRLRGVSIVQPTSVGVDRTELVFCKEVELNCSPTMPELLQGKIDIYHIRLRGCVLRAIRNTDGQWNLQDLLSNPCETKLPSLSIEDGEIAITDMRRPVPIQTVIRNVKAEMTPPAPSNEDQRIAVRCEFTNHHLDQAKFQCWLDPVSLGWSAAGEATNLVVTPEFIKAVGPAVPSQLAQLQGFRAGFNVRFRAAKGQQESVPRFDIVAKMFDGRLEKLASLPNPLVEISADVVRYDNYELNGWQASGVRARYGVAVLDVVSADGGLTGDFRCRGTVRDLTLTRNMRELLSPKLQATWDRYQPLGLVDIAFAAERFDNRWKLATNTNCRDISLQCVYFPYPLSRVQGFVGFRQDEKLDVNLQAAIDPTQQEFPVTIRADIVRPGPNFEGRINVVADWLPLDRKLKTALSPTIQRILTQINALGDVAFQAEFWRNAETKGRLHKDITVDVRNATANYESFPYPLQDIVGKVHVTESLWTFDDFRGRNDSCNVTCSGRWIPLATRLQNAAGLQDAASSQDAANQPTQMVQSNSGELHLAFNAKDIHCDAELRDALPAAPRRIWESLRPTGNIDHAKINLVHRTDMPKPELDIVVTQLKRQHDPGRRSLEIRPTWFPLTMSRVTGIVNYRRDGTFQMQNLQAEHGPIQHAVELQAQGNGVFRDDGSWGIRLERIFADGFSTSPELTAALPKDLGQAMRSLDFHGKLSVNAREMTFSGSNQPDAPIESTWASVVNVDNGRFVLAGHPVQNVYGAINVVGRSDGNGWKNVGRAHVGSLMCRGVQVTEIDTPWLMDPNRLVFGAGASANASETELPHLTARLFGGVAQADGVVGLADNNAFRVDVGLSNFDVARVASDFATTAKISGRGEARLQVSGNAEGTHTLKGTGGIRLRDANLGKLPAIITLLNNLKVRNAPPDVFSSSEIDFAIEGPYVNLSRFDLHGESLNLKGDGWISLDRKIDLKFYPIFGDERRWLPWAKSFSKQLIQIVVTGTLDNMEWSPVTGLNARATN